MSMRQTYECLMHSMHVPLLFLDCESPLVATATIAFAISSVIGSSRSATPSSF